MHIRDSYPSLSAVELALKNGVHVVTVFPHLFNKMRSYLLAIVIFRKKRRVLR